MGITLLLIFMNLLWATTTTTEENKQQLLVPPRPSFLPSKHWVHHSTTVSAHRSLHCSNGNFPRVSLQLWTQKISYHSTVSVKLRHCPQWDTCPLWLTLHKFSSNKATCKCDKSSIWTSIGATSSQVHAQKWWGGWSLILYILNMISLKHEHDFVDALFIPCIVNCMFLGYFF